MNKLWKLIVVVLALGVTASIEPTALLAQCAQCDSSAPDGCKYGPFAEPNYGQCTFVVGMCFETGACGETFVANQAAFSLDGLAIVPIPTAANGDYAADPVKFESRSVFWHCSGLVASVAD